MKLINKYKKKKVMNAFKEIKETILNWAKDIVDEDDKEKRKEYLDNGKKRLDEWWPTKE